jgi:hypothetical protein
MRYCHVKRSCFGHEEGCTSAGGGSELAGDVVDVGVRLANHRDATFAAGDIDPPIGCAWRPPTGASAMPEENCLPCPLCSRSSQDGLDALAANDV